MNRSSRDPDAYDRIREDASVLGRTCGYCGFTGDMMAYAHHVCPRDVMQSEIDSLRAQLAAANAKDSEKTREINLLTQENRQQAARLAAATERERGYVALLGDVEWVLDKEYLYRYCPECEQAQSDGHADGCRIAAALAAAQPDSDGQEGE